MSFAPLKCKHGSEGMDKLRQPETSKTDLISTWLSEILQLKYLSILFLGQNKTGSNIDIYVRKTKRSGVIKTLGFKSVTISAVPSQASLILTCLHVKCMNMLFCT